MTQLQTIIIRRLCLRHHKFSRHACAPFFVLLFPQMFLLTGHFCYFVFIFSTRRTNHSANGGRKVTAMIMLTSSEDVCQSSITFARMNVMARSLYEESTNSEEVCCTNCSATIHQHVTGNTQCATHICGECVHMWTG
jgi:hypothetical protein